jgi:hypothetical protein
MARDVSRLSGVRYMDIKKHKKRTNKDKRKIYDQEIEKKIDSRKMIITAMKVR